VNDGGYRECSENCEYGSRCGDGNVDEGFEECDEGAENGRGSCRADCTREIER
jgi:hypothetical protein